MDDSKFKVWRAPNLSWHSAQERMMDVSKLEGREREFRLRMALYDQMLFECRIAIGLSLAALVISLGRLLL